ncbi:unnamed protein product [Sphagnum jensenii]|uniref:Programmed cell death protein 7 n=1 Tax=Sphagnum jensenii TaxID=128206 RepID=A0ABP0WGG1_9BRYO
MNLSIREINRTPPSTQHHWLPPDFPVQPLWQRFQLRRHLSELSQHLSLLKAVLMETEMQSSNQLSRTIDTQEPFTSDRCARFITAIREGGSNELQAREAAANLQQKVEGLLEPLQAALSGQGGWENAAAAAQLANKQLKIQRNRRWRQRKRQKIGKALQKEHEGYEEADQKADEWRAREIAKLIAKRKMEKMKEVAEKKAKEERARLEEELEMVLMVEKLQELRALRIQKLKKQGRFFPDEDDKFMERIRAAVEEEERQAAAASDTNAAAAAIASAAEARKAVSTLSVMDGGKDDIIPLETTHTDTSAQSTGAVLPTENNPAEDVQDVTKEERGALQEGYGGLPPELYHYYYGSHADMGTLIEVRRGWDAFIMPGGSRIPGHWIQAPPPADSVWASYIKRPETDNKCLMKESKAIFKTGQKRKKLSQQQGQ